MLAKVGQQRKMQRQDGSGRPRTTTEQEDRAIVRMAVAAPESTLSTIQHDRHTSVQNGQQATERAESKSSPTVTMPNPHTRSCTDKSDYSGVGSDQLGTALTEDSRFLLCPDNRRKRVWRRPGQRVDPGLTVEHHTGPQQGVMVWGAISFDSRTPLVVIPGTLTAQRYVDDILWPVLLPFLSHHPGLTFQQDNARPHTARPARSPDLSPIEHIWDVMGRRLQPSRNVDYLARQLETIWQEIPQHTIRNLYQSMTRRVASRPVVVQRHIDILNFCKENFQIAPNPSKIPYYHVIDEQRQSSVSPLLRKSIVPFNHTQNSTFIKETPLTCLQLNSQLSTLCKTTPMPKATPMCTPRNVKTPLLRTNSVKKLIEKFEDQSLGKTPEAEGTFRMNLRSKSKMNDLTASAKRTSPEKRQSGKRIREETPDCALPSSKKIHFQEPQLQGLEKTTRKNPMRMARKYNTRISSTAAQAEWIASCVQIAPKLRNGLDCSTLGPAKGLTTPHKSILRGGAPSSAVKASPRVESIRTLHLKEELDRKDLKHEEVLRAQEEARKMKLEEAKRRREEKRKKVKEQKELQEREKEEKLRLKEEQKEQQKEMERIKQQEKLKLQAQM
ncbi:hypothetical protein LAZ67_19002125 [Cordylochernes scorpioides]|uniref:Transposase n=1 Tax=Cordylochernes scorpioides TaxID=51811 RepID=A0ABY6LL45_9ARAC|nr:hypothetical protein LAZ67_19002125 [Cordylochernes scorpioides]